MKDVAENISLLDAIYLLDEAWQAVKPPTISNCYRHSGFHKNHSSGDEFDLLQDIDLPFNLSREDFEFMVQVDESAETTGHYTDEELVLATKKAGLQTEDEDDVEEEEEEIKMEEIISALKVVRKYSKKKPI